MARLPAFKRLVTEDFASESKWIGKLLQPINQFFANVVIALNKNLTFAENFAAQVNRVSIQIVNTTDRPTYTDNFPVKYAWNLPAKPSAIWVVNAVDNKTASSAAITDPVYASWTYRDNVIILNNVTNLPASASEDSVYTVTLIGVTG